MSDSERVQNDPPRLKPVLHEILRTCIHPRKISLRVEHVVQIKVDHNGNQEADESVKSDDVSKGSGGIRLFLTDGELLIQGLLHQRVYNNVSTKLVSAGSVVEIYDFEVKRARRSKGPGHVLFLGIRDCTFHESITSERQTSVAEIQSRTDPTVPNIEETSKDANDTAGGFIRDGTEDDVLIARDVSSHRNGPKLRSINDTTGLTREGDHEPVAKADTHQTPDHSSLRAKIPSSKRKLREALPSDEEEDAFETAQIDLGTAKKRRQTLLEFDYYDHEIDEITRDLPISGQAFPDMGQRVAKPKVSFDLNLADIGAISFLREEKAEKEEEEEAVGQVRKSPEATKHPRRSVRFDLANIGHHPPVVSEPPIHTLRSLLHPTPGHSLPRKNYTLTTFAIITYVGTSLISRPGSPFPPKRHIKIDDPSLHTRSTTRNDSKSRYASASVAASAATAAAAASNIINNTQTQTKGVTVAVYRDALNFKPEVGTPGLFRGLVMQRLANRDIILNAYPTLKAKIGQAWKKPTKDVETGGSASAVAATVTTNPPNVVVVPQAEDQETNPIRYETTTETNPAVALGEEDWFITSPTLLRKMGYDTEALRSWWLQTHTVGGRSR